MSQDSYSPPIAVGIDDGYFPPEKRGKTILAGVLYVGKTPIKALLDLVDIDGTDATAKSVSLAQKLLSARGKDAVIFLDGVTYAGFNYIDPEALSDRTGAHVVSIFYRRPVEEKVFEALKTHFPDWRKRWRVIGKAISSSRRIHTRMGGLDCYSTTPDYSLVQKIVNYFQLYSRIPEPLRTADLVASSVSRYLRSNGFLK